jgi:hypothetical protein
LGLSVITLGIGLVGISSWIVYADMMVDNKQTKLFKLYSLKFNSDLELFIALATFAVKVTAFKPI